MAGPVVFRAVLPVTINQDAGDPAGSSAADMLTIDLTGCQPGDVVVCSIGVTGSGVNFAPPAGDTNWNIGSAGMPGGFCFLYSVPSPVPATAIMQNQANPQPHLSVACVAAAYSNSTGKNNDAETITYGGVNGPDPSRTAGPFGGQHAANDTIVTGQVIESDTGNPGAVDAPWTLRGSSVGRLSSGNGRYAVAQLADYEADDTSTQTVTWHNDASFTWLPTGSSDTGHGIFLFDGVYKAPPAGPRFVWARV